MEEVGVGMVEVVMVQMQQTIVDFHIVQVEIVAWEGAAAASEEGRLDAAEVEVGHHHCHTFQADLQTAPAAALGMEQRKT